MNMITNEVPLMAQFGDAEHCSACWTTLKAEPSRCSALVRLRRREDGAVEVRSCAAKSRAVSNRNCVVATRGGEQRDENDQSVTQTVPSWPSR